MSLRGLMYQLSSVEDSKDLFKPEYLKMRSESEEAEIFCGYCEHCTTPDDYCDEVIARFDRKQLLLSAANRLIHSMMEHGCMTTINNEACRRSYGDVEFDWEEYSKYFCQWCPRAGTDCCPEDTCDASCVRHDQAMVIEQVVSTVNELI